MGAVLGETFRETLPSPPLGVVKMGRWKLHIAHAQPLECDRIIRYRIEAVPCPPGVDRRTPEVIHLERNVFAYRGMRDREYEVLKQAYEIVRAYADTRCCVKHLLLRTYDGTECVGL